MWISNYMAYNWNNFSVPGMHIPQFYEFHSPDKVGLGLVVMKLKVRKQNKNFKRLL